MSNNKIHIYDYMKKRAKTEGLRHELTRGFYNEAVSMGCRTIFGVEVDEFGFVNLWTGKDLRNPSFFASLKEKTKNKTI